MEKFRELKVWQKAHDLTLAVYKITTSYPDTEKYGLVSQMRRAAVSVVANIVEGTKRKTIADRAHFHTMADTSLEELKYYVILSSDLKLILSTDAENLSMMAREVGAMLNSLTKKL
ncbi:hypothetical protein A3D60_00425 [Candidatus Uhrbacteria bacterium RIFCSPHIGHO2_02_FULL_47_29]|uniref:Four helix bundle protein n=1 Tax=Candidatus Uhrbacteria bacterium RIFCSPLOWO2_01_FULL_47_25 TaxID=1802402 RepID=A0A1F7USI2_9BACT|nr:MAG: S23 ribosomal protein [Parcubacteria group bacterium GW2011_GWA2_46_9]OGL60855.1 MAG: hypothetical protein A2752_00390 [Candidatus Uhrbacteria bacterium RIFCSPHIGHO2_01_FULL_46_23]OGL68241.1 MAG: hypothetical protein A3D60_00425 [Candidatus Uhrbacteria bacterium RIFCSPHIGHO2_02_FULL_47_29]OGL81251.1 MAG: hypothetical protein A2936_03070 [Candidatus Uhrbacteria bacterium RIFCSPLOWO2_01_FULL_47_25]OGL86028.1 MAG: hypothetical protein A3I37_01410 [Candidatus Uhrbacteria bacterium RIFCSPLOW